MNDEPIYTTEEAAQLLRVHKMTIRRWIETGKIHPDEWFRPGKDYRILGRAVLRLRSDQGGFKADPRVAS